MAYESNEARNKRRARKRQYITLQVSKQLKELIDNESLLIKTILDIADGMPHTNFKNVEYYYECFKFKLMLSLPIGNETYGMGKYSYNLVKDIVSKQFNLNIKPILNRLIKQKAFW